MKKMFFYASLLLAAATLNSCSQDSDLAADEAATAAADALTPEQKAQIMELAEYYDLDVTIDDRPATRGAGQEFNIDSVEADGDVVSTAYYSIQGSRVSNAYKGIVIKVDTMADGTVKTTKLMK